MLFGPVAALVFGFIADILGFLVISPGTFFPGYTLSAMLGAFIYSIFLYRTRITVLKIFLAKLTVNVFVNSILGSLWLHIMLYNPEIENSKTFIVYLTGGFLKNMILLPFEVVLLVIMFKRIIPISKSFNLISDDVSNEIKLI
jgi:ECF transporter S component (folate family)